MVGGHDVERRGIGEERRTHVVLRCAHLRVAKYTSVANGYRLVFVRRTGDGVALDDEGGDGGMRSSRLFLVTRPIETVLFESAASNELAAREFD